MNTTEKLHKIKAECQRLLALAEKRTPGAWEVRSVDTDPKYTAGLWFHVGPAAMRSSNDAAFIAACAGPAEAGWRATIAAIDGLLSLATAPNVEAPHEMHEAWEGVASEAREQLDKIITAWEGLV